MFNPQGAKNTEEVIITESVIDAAALWSAGLRNVIPVYGVTGLTEEIIAHLVECRVKRVVLLLDADDSGRAVAVDMALNEQQIAYNPATTLQLPKQPHRLPRGVLTKSEARRLIEATPTTKPRDIRDRAILETLYRHRDPSRRTAGADDL